ncbi:YncE family protein [Pseudomonas sp. LF052]
MSTVPGTYDLLTDLPYSAFQHVPLRDPDDPALPNTLYPETAVVGWGQRQVLPTTRITTNAWHTLSINDNHSIYINNAQVAADFVRAIRPSYDLNITGTTLRDGEVSLFARVQRAGSGQESRSEPRTVLIKTTLPGGIDRVLGDTWLSGLNMRIENLPEGSVIDPDVAAAGMWCLIDKYENARKNDTIDISVGGVFVTHTLSPAEAAGPGPFRVYVPSNIFARISQSGPVEVSFQVTDVVKNVSGGLGAKYTYSRPVTLESELDTRLLPYPLFNVNGIESALVDLDTQSNAIFTVVATGLPRVAIAPAPPNRVVVRLTITRPDGSINIVTLPPVNDRNVRTETITVDPNVIRQLAGSTFRVAFETQTAAGSPLARSGSYQVRVVGTPVVAPLVRPLINGTPNNGTLDLNKFAGNGLLSMEKWPSSAAGQRVWITASSEGVADLVVLNGAVPITANEALNGLANIPVLRTWLQQVKSGRITLTGGITLNGSTDPAMAVAFLPTTYDIRLEVGIVQTIAVGGSPHFIALTRDGSTAYLTNTHSNTVSVIDVASRSVVQTLGGFVGPYRILLHPTQPRLYVMNLFGNTISVVDLNSRAIIQTFTGFRFGQAPAGSINREGLAINAEGTRLYVSSQIDSQVYVIDAYTGVRVNTIAVTNPSGVAFNPLQNVMYVAGSGRVSVAAAADAGGVFATVPGPATLFNVDFTPNAWPKPRAYVTANGYITIIDTLTRQVVQQIPRGYTFSLAMNPVTQECYVGTDAREITVIDTQTENVTRVIPGFFHPAGIAVLPGGRMMMVANNAASTLSFVAI